MTERWHDRALYRWADGGLWPLDAVKGKPAVARAVGVLFFIVWTPIYLLVTAPFFAVIVTVALLSVFWDETT